LYSIYGATTPVGLSDACLQDLLLGLSRSWSNTNNHVKRRDICTKRQKWRRHRAHESQMQWEAIKHDHNEVTQCNCSLQDLRPPKQSVSWTSGLQKAYHCCCPQA